MSCGGSSAKGSKHASTTRKGAPGELMSYRLLLRENPVDPGEAFRCYGRCQDRPSPKSYLDCLSQCPGFAVDADVACDEHDVPPVAACITVRKIPASATPEPGFIVLAVVGSFALVVGAAALCASSKSQCGYESYPPPH